MSTDYKFEGWMGDDASSSEGKMVWREFQPKTWEETDVDIKVTHSGICGSDLHTLRSGWVGLISIVDIISFCRRGVTDSSLLRALRNIRVLSGTKSLASRFELDPKLRVISKLAILSVSVLRAMPVLVATVLALLAMQACLNTAKAASSHTTPDTATRTNRTEAMLYTIVLLRTSLSRSLKALSPSMLLH